MENNKAIIWLASYPRSGNTLLRTILWQCFGLRSASIYPNDLDGNAKLAEYVGHIDHDQNKQIRFPVNAIPLIKTHKFDLDNNRAIYVIRDGRAVCISFWQFYKKRCPLESVIDGKHQFGTWSSHVQSWNPWERPNTLLLKYEDMIADLPATISSISAFLGKEIISKTLPDRNALSGEDGRWVRAYTDWRTELYGELLERFNQTNRDVLVKAGYCD